ncbi:hypothetical protein CVT25_012394 [Psilocybe cyanescens]|uniref:CCHC-type domain-containing protein n=1 Tax=Psilocybe cyanescens TaxID=93625 RepID=A0A409W6W4_PSICY|nr:hypothetical protein CVT25_012394 [Psilocybe cyanescens]
MKFRFPTSTSTTLIKGLKVFVNVLSTTFTIQQPDSGPWLRLSACQSIADIERDGEARYLPPTILDSGTGSDTLDSESSELSESSFSTPSSPRSSLFVLSPATWPSQELGSATPDAQLSPTPPPSYFSHNDNEFDMADTFFTGKPKDENPQDFMNRLERTLIMKTGLTEENKVKLFQLLLKANSPAAAWFSTLASNDKTTFDQLRIAFEVHWPVKPITEKTPQEKQIILEETILQYSDLGKRVAGSIGGEEELSHVVWANKVERLVKEIPDTNNLLVNQICKKLPKPLQKLIRSKVTTWTDLVTTVCAITLVEITDQLEEERDLARLTNLAIPNPPMKALTAAFQKVSVTIAAPPQHHTVPTTSYQQPFTQPAPRPSHGSFVDRPLHERLANVLSKALPIQPNSPDGIARYSRLASGECWKCGQRSHHPAPCSSPAVPALETKWRSIAQTIRKKAEMAAAPVNIVEVESDEVQTYDVEDLAHLHNLINQGKAEGLSM